MNNSRIPIYLVILVALLVVGGVAYMQYTRTPNVPPGNNKKGNADGLVYLENGLNPAERAEFYHLAEGSEIYPVLWMQALKTKEGKYFLDDVERLGFLPDPDNVDGLPVGLTSGVTRGLEALGPMSGLNCAACHVGELHYQGKRVRIDGAPNLVNTREFFVTLIDSAIDTAKDPAKLLAFVVKVHEIEEQKNKTPPSKLRQLGRKVLVKVVEKQEEVLHAALKPLLDQLIADEFGAKPFDFKSTLKEGAKDVQSFREKLTRDLKLDKVVELAKHSTVLKDLSDEAEKHSTLKDLWQDIYIKLRLLRGRAEFLKKLGMVGEDKRTEIWGPGRVDAFGSARAFLFQTGYAPLTPVSYPPIFELKSHDWFHYDNNTTTFLERNFGQALGVGAVWDADSKSYSLQPKNLRRLESLAHQLKAPKWPEKIFGAIDQVRAKRGEKLYEKYCALCHDAEKNKRFDDLDKLELLKTDTARATMFAEKVPPTNEPFPDMIRKTLADIKTVALKEFSDAEQAEILKDPVAWRGPSMYSARTINGAWSTAPYLHNGSVPTLDDLLKPAKDRPATFYVGSHQFDPQRLGYVEDKNGTLFDTSKLGNSNAGHEGERYGTHISAEERKDLLEYLKSR